MIGKASLLIKQTASGFLADEALTRGAAIAYYIIFSIAPLLIIVIAIAGLDLVAARLRAPAPAYAVVPCETASRRRPTCWRRAPAPSDVAGHGGRRSVRRRSGPLTFSPVPIGRLH